MCACFGARTLASSAFVNEVVLWSPPEISGWLEKKGEAKKKSWRKKFFVLKGNYLFYFKSSKASSPEGVVPLEYALVDIDQEQKDLETTRHTIQVTLHRAYGSYCKESEYKFGSTSQDVQATWVAALKHAAIPRQDLLTELKNAGRLETILLSAEQSAQARKSKISFFKPEGFKLPQEMEYENFVPQGDVGIPAGQNPLNVDPGTPPRASMYEMANRSAMEEQISQLEAQQDDLQRMLDRRLSQLPQHDSMDVSMNRGISQEPPSDISKSTFAHGLTSLNQLDPHGQSNQRPPDGSIQQELDRGISKLPSEQVVLDHRAPSTPQSNPFQSEDRWMSRIPQGHTPRESFNFVPHTARVSFAPLPDSQGSSSLLRSPHQDQGIPPRLSATNLAGIDRLESAVNAAGFQSVGDQQGRYGMERKAYGGFADGVQRVNHDRSAMFVNQQAQEGSQSYGRVETNNASPQGFREEHNVLHSSTGPRVSNESQLSGVERSLTDDQRNVARRMKATSFAGYNLGLRALSDEYDGGVGRPESYYSHTPHQIDIRTISEARYREEERLRQLMERPFLDSREAELQSWKSLPAPNNTMNVVSNPFPVLNRPGVQESFNDPNTLQKQGSLPIKTSDKRMVAPPPPPPPFGSLPRVEALKAAGASKDLDAKKPQISGSSWSEDEDTQPRPSDFAFQNKAHAASPPSVGTARSVDSKMSFEDELKSRLATRRARLDSNIHGL